MSYPGANTPPREPKVAGEGFVRVSVTLTALAISVFGALLVVVVPAACIYLDVKTGPDFVDAYASTRGWELGGITMVIPYLISVSTTGLQYALIDRLRVAFEQRGSHAKLKTTSVVLIAVAVVVALGDTITDGGGVTSWRYPPEEAANIVPNRPDLAWAIQVGVVMLLCLCHEPLLASLLKYFHGEIFDKSFPGAVVMHGGIIAAGWILSVAKGVFLPLGVFSMFILDIIMLPQIETTAAMEVLMWCLSFALTGLQWLLWWHHDRVGMKRAAKIDRVFVYVAWGVAVLDTVFDMIAYTTAMYGDGTGIVYIPENPTAVWVLGLVVLAPVCFAGERMYRELLQRPTFENPREAFAR